MKFNQLGIKPELLKGVENRGYKYVTPIQEHAIPAILEGKDLLGGAQTGTGKTAAFALPILDLLSRTESKPTAPRALVLVPTRELAEQVGDSFISYGQFLNLRTVKVYGGTKMGSQISNLKKGTDIVVATPGRLMDHLEQKSIDLSKLKILVLDEADRMLDMGFIEDITTIIKSVPVKRQTLLFSATYNNSIDSLAKEILKRPVSVEVSKRNAAATEVEQMVHFVEKKDRFDLLAHLILEGQWYQVLIFVKTKQGADRLTSQLLKKGIPSSAIHGDKSQGARNRALREFKKGDLQALVATDVAARGIDLNDLSHVINYELPQIPEDYIHRIGRTGRAGKTGIAISLVSFSETTQLKKIEKILSYSIPHKNVPGFEAKHDFNTKPEEKPTNGKPARTGYAKNKHEYEPTGSGGRHRKVTNTRGPKTDRTGATSGRGTTRSDKPGYDRTTPEARNGNHRGAGRTDKPGYGSRNPEERNGNRRGAGRTDKPGYDSRRPDERNGNRRGTGRSDKPGYDSRRPDERTSNRRGAGRSDKPGYGSRTPEERNGNRRGAGRSDKPGYDSRRPESPGGGRGRTDRQENPSYSRKKPDNRRSKTPWDAIPGAKKS